MERQPLINTNGPQETTIPQTNIDVGNDSNSSSEIQEYETENGQSASSNNSEEDDATHSMLK